MSTFLRASVPINKLDCFHDVLEENGYRLAGRHPLSDIIPFHPCRGEATDTKRDQWKGCICYV